MSVASRADRRLAVHDLADAGQEVLDHLYETCVPLSENLPQRRHAGGPASISTRPRHFRLQSVTVPVPTIKNSAEAALERR
jgi:hypothetical protein